MSAVNASFVSSRLKEPFIVPGPTSAALPSPTSTIVASVSPCEIATSNVDWKTALATSDNRTVAAIVAASRPGFVALGICINLRPTCASTPPIEPSARVESVADAEKPCNRPP